MNLMSLRCRTHVNAYMVLTIAYNLLIQNYIRSLINIILIHFLIPVRTRLEPLSYRTYIYIYIYSILHNCVSDALAR